MLVRGAGTAVVVALCLGAGLLVAKTIRHWRIPMVSQAMASDPPPQTPAISMMTVASGNVTARPVANPGGAASARRPTAPLTTQSWYSALSSHSPPFPLVVAQGTTRLTDSVVVVRDGEVVRVHFDTPGARTRRADKFEQIVRATLPALYGPLADSLLAQFPIAPLVVRAGGLLAALPAHGLRLPLGTGWVLALWPETRPGQDGPLVVTYRATVMRGTPD